jgi:hypothetical protein
VLQVRREFYFPSISQYKNVKWRSAIAAWTGASRQDVASIEPPGEREISRYVNPVTAQNHLVPVDGKNLRSEEDQHTKHNAGRSVTTVSIVNYPGEIQQREDQDQTHDPAQDGRHCRAGLSVHANDDALCFPAHIRLTQTHTSVAANIGLPATPVSRNSLRNLASHTS